MSTEIGLRDSEFADRKADPTTVDGKKVYPKYKTRVAVIRNGRSELCILTEKKVATLKELGVPEPILAECEAQMAKADAETRAMNPTRNFDEPVRKSGIVSGVSVAALLARAKAKA